MKNIITFFNNKALTIHPKMACVLAAGSLGVLVQLFCWNFELRSISRLFMQSALLSVVFWLGLNFLIYRKLHQPIRFNFQAMPISGVSSFVFGFQVVPPQSNDFRYAITISIAVIMFFVFFSSFLVVLFDVKKIAWKVISYCVFFLYGMLAAAIILINSLSVRLYADDFFHAVLSETLGIWPAALYFYRAWSDRFFSNILIMAFVHQPKVLSVLLMLVFLATFFSVKSIFKKSLLLDCLAALAFTFYIPFSIFSVAPDLYKSLYWMSSALTLIPLLILIPVYLALMVYFSSSDPPAHKGLLVMSFLLGIAISTTHEVAVLGWLAMHGIGLISVITDKSKKDALRSFLNVGIAAAVIGLLIILLSPGGHTRAVVQEYPITNDPIILVRSTIRFFADFLNNISKPYYDFHSDARPGWLLIIAVSGLGYITDAPFDRCWKTTLIILITAIAMTAVSFFPGAYVLGSSIPERTQLIPSIYLVLGLYITALFIPRFQKKQLNMSLGTFIILLLISGSLRSLNQLQQTMAPMRQFASEWDLRDARVSMHSELPYPIFIPWDEYEQNFHDVRLYYCDYIQDFVDCDDVRRRSDINPDWFDN